MKGKMRYEGQHFKKGGTKCSLLEDYPEGIWRFLEEWILITKINVSRCIKLKNDLKYAHHWLVCHTIEDNYVYEIVLQSLINLENLFFQSKYWPIQYPLEYYVKISAGWLDPTPKLINTTETETGETME